MRMRLDFVQESATRILRFEMILLDWLSMQTKSPRVNATFCISTSAEEEIVVERFGGC